MRQVSQPEASYPKAVTTRGPVATESGTSRTSAASSVDGAGAVAVREEAEKADAPAEATGPERDNSPAKAKDDREAVDMLERPHSTTSGEWGNGGVRRVTLDRRPTAFGPSS